MRLWTIKEHCERGRSDGGLTVDIIDGDIVVHDNIVSSPHLHVIDVGR